MSDEQGPPSGPAGSRKRPGPTIDLKATEIASEPGAGAEPPPRTEAGAPKASPLGAALGWLPAGLPGPLVGAGAGGAVAALLLVLLAGQFFGHGGGRAPQETRLARVEQQVRGLAARPAATGVDPKTVDDLAGRVGSRDRRGDAAAACHRSGLGEPHGDARRPLKSIDEKVGIVARAPTTSASSRATPSNAPMPPRRRWPARPEGDAAGPQTVDHGEVEAPPIGSLRWSRPPNGSRPSSASARARDRPDRAARLASRGAAALDAAAERRAVRAAPRP